MNEQARKYRAEYLKEWRRKNPEKQRRIMQRYWDKKASLNNPNLPKEELIDQLQNGTHKDRNDKILTGLYLEPGLHMLLIKLGRIGGRGAKSQIANDALRQYFRQKGLL